MYVLLILLAVVAFALIRSWFWPYGRCPACTGRKGRGIGSTDSAFSRCRRCGGKGERVRPLALIWPRWRAEWRAVREQRRAK